MKQIKASVFFDIYPPTLGNNIFLLVLSFVFNFIKIGRLYYIAAIGAIAKNLAFAEYLLMTQNYPET